MSLACFAALTLLVAAFLLRGGIEVVSSRRIEIIGHAGASAAMTTSFAGSWIARRARRPDVLGVMGGGTVATLVLELSQGLVPVRVVQLDDVLIGFGGVLIASMAIEVVLRAMPLPIALRLHSTAASAGSLALLALIVAG